MKVLVLLEAVFERTPDGRIWSRGVFTTSFFQRYLGVFDRVTITARVREVRAANTGDHEVADDQFEFAQVPAYRGLGGYVMQQGAIRTAMTRALAEAEAVILRVPSPLAGRLYSRLLSERRPFGVEVVGDPWDSFAPGAIRHPFRPILRWRLRNELRQQCRAACAAAYVTAGALQERYPTATETPTFSYSSIELREDCFATTPRSLQPNLIALRIVSVGTMSQRYKGHDVLLRAIAASRHPSTISLTLVGDGAERSALERLARELGLAASVRFAGHLADPLAVRCALDQADAFVLASRQEGLPRAIIEAMARGLPCLSTLVGGIPELLPAAALVPPDDHQALARLLDDRLRDSRWMADASMRNLAHARIYHDEVLRGRRQAFYQVVKDATKRWKLRT